jgi:membrane protease YdiL (CAAX protease family)
MSDENHVSIKQYSLVQIVLIWLSATIPIGIFGWIVAPFFSKVMGNIGIARMAAITIGLIWQFVLVLILLYKENHNISWKIIKAGLWLNQPNIPRTNKKMKLLWLILLPLIIITAVYQIGIAKYIITFWTSLFPIFTEPPLFSLSNYLGSPEGSGEIVGKWGFFILYIICAIFNTFLGEEFLFRGLLLPRMNKVFGKFDWVINGVLFGAYHIHQPWGILSTIILATFIFSFFTKLFKCTWFGIILHSGQSIFFIITMLGMMLIGK